MADAARCADCGDVAPLSRFDGAWFRDGVPQQGGMLCALCIERWHAPSREDYESRIAGRDMDDAKRHREALVAWNRDQLAREAMYQVRRLKAEQAAAPHEEDHPPAHSGEGVAMPQAENVLLGLLIQHGHTPRITNRTGAGYIKAECIRCGLIGAVFANAAGEYVEECSQGEGFEVECPMHGDSGSP